MAVPYVDTNVLIRLITGDDVQKQAASQALFEQVERGTLTVAAPDTAIADAVFVLSDNKTYNLPRAQISSILTTLVRLPHFQVKNRQMILKALALYGTSSLDFGDVCILAAMEQDHSSVVYSYDTDFNNIPGVSRKEPGAR